MLDCERRRDHGLVWKRRRSQEIFIMPGSTRSTQLAVALVVFAGSSSLAQVNLSDVTMGADPPAGAVVLYDGGEKLGGWVKLDGKTTADWPVSDGFFTVG